MRQKSPQTKHHDVIIVGGGLAGMSLALFLAKRQISCVLLDREDPQKLLTESHDRRTTAISFASHLVLDQAGVWDNILADAAPITDILVTDEGALPKVFDIALPLLGRRLNTSLDFSARDEGSGDPFGWIIQNRTLRRALYAAVLAQKDFISYHAPAKAVAFNADAFASAVTLKTGQKYTASLLIGADGRQSAVRRWLGIDVREWPYHQSALVFNMTHERAHHGMALEHFTPAGPFAVLPMTRDEETRAHRSSVVWTVEENDVQNMLALPAKDFAARLQKICGDRLGRVQVATPPMAYPLRLMHAKKYIGRRTALLAEAAHVIHPIAGQGLNLSMRDIFALGSLLMQAKNLGLDLGSATLLEKYESQRRPDTMAMALFTDALNKLFSNNIDFVHYLRSLGLGGINQIPPLKSFFARQAMGLNQIMKIEEQI